MSTYFVSNIITKHQPKNVAIFHPFITAYSLLGLLGMSYKGNISVFRYRYFYLFLSTYYTHFGR